MHHEWGVLVSTAVTLQPVEGLIGKAVGGVAFLLKPFAIDVEGLVKV